MKFKSFRDKWSASVCQSMSTEAQKLPIVERVCYGFGDLASCLFWQTLTLYLLFFYTDVFGLSAVAAGIMIGVSRFLDAMFDVIIGMAADRTKTRWGKFRPYILWGATPLAVSAVLAFSTPALGGTTKIVYAYVTFISFMLLYSTVNIPYTSLLGVISGDPIERTSASSFKFVGAYAGGIVVSATALPLVAHFGGQDAAKGWTMTLVTYGVAAVLLFLITFAMTHERIQPIAKERTPIKSDLEDIAKNVPWLVLFAATILFILFVCIRMSVTTHYFKYFVGAQSVSIFGTIHRFGFETLASAYNTLGQVLSLVGVMLVPWFAKLCGRKRALVILMVVALICTGAFYFFEPNDLGLIFSFQAVGSLAGGPISALLWVLYADTADYSEWKTGRRATGLVFSASIMSNKIGWTVGSVIAGFILATTGFAPNLAQNPDVLKGLKSMMSVVPAAAGALTLAILVLFYKLDETLMAKVKTELDVRRNSS
jgi:glycoside/pentoside/hexuronide:cation symporter, GPH family